MKDHAIRLMEISQGNYPELAVKFRLFNGVPVVVFLSEPYDNNADLVLIWDGKKADGVIYNDFTEASKKADPDDYFQLFQQLLEMGIFPKIARQMTGTHVRNRYWRVRNQNTSMWPSNDPPWKDEFIRWYAHRWHNKLPGETIFWREIREKMQELNKKLPLTHGSLGPYVWYSIFPDLLKAL